MSTPKERLSIPHQDKREYPHIELDNPETYIHFPSEQVMGVLAGLGYDESMMRVHELFVNPDDTHYAVGVWNATQDEGHFVGNPVLRGVEQTEAIAQTLLVAAILTGRVEEGMSPRLTWQDVENKNTAIPPVQLNVAVFLIPTDKTRNLTGYGEVRLGDSILTQGYIGGVILPNDLSTRLLERTKKHQGTAVNPFPPLKR